jgi:hypothetical protein
MINLYKRVLTLIGTNMCPGPIFAVILVDHVVLWSHKPASTPTFDHETNLEQGTEQ